MIWKLITLAGAAFALWSFARRALGARPGGGARLGRRGADGAESYERCAVCGAWRPAGGDCACRTPPTP